MTPTINPVRKAVPTSKENIERINAFFKSIEDRFVNLYGRWQDEKEYEDINDYGKVIQANMPTGFKLVTMMKRPFGFTFQIGTDAVYCIDLKGVSYSWRRIK